MKKTFKIILLVISLYMSLAYMVYRFGHPEQTETQLLFNFIDAMTWK